MEAKILVNLSFIGSPYPIVITSDPEGKYPYNYVLRWEKPRTGGLPIREYEFKYRQVSAMTLKQCIHIIQKKFRFPKICIKILFSTSVGFLLTVLGTWVRIW